VTARAKAVATAASTALPPRRRTSAATWAECRSGAATAAASRRAACNEPVQARLRASNRKDAKRDMTNSSDEAAWQSVAAIRNPFRKSVRIRAPGAQAQLGNARG